MCTFHHVYFSLSTDDWPWPLKCILWGLWGCILRKLLVYSAEYIPVINYLLINMRWHVTSRPESKHDARTYWGAKLFSVVHVTPLNFTFFCYISKLKRVWRQNFRFAIRKISAFISNQKLHYFRLSPGLRMWHKGFLKSWFALLWCVMISSLLPKLR